MYIVVFLCNSFWEIQRNYSTMGKKFKHNSCSKWHKQLSIFETLEHYFLVSCLNDNGLFNSFNRFYLHLITVSYDTKQLFIIYYFNNTERSTKTTVGIFEIKFLS